MTTTIVNPEAVTRVSVENHARAVLARLCGAHHLPIAPDGIRWHEPSLPGVAWLPHTLWVTVASRDDVDLWAIALGAEAEDADQIRVSTDDAWLVSRDRRVIARDWLPGVRLWVEHSEVRIARIEARI